MRAITVGNIKIGENVPTESRPIHLTCPAHCPLWTKCYAYRTALRRKNVQTGMIDRERERLADRAAWRAHRRRAWTRAAAKGLPVRFLVNGDVGAVGDETFGGRGVDRGWLADVLRAARGIPGFRGWMYTHYWRELPRKTHRALERAGIRVWASVHGPEDARDAEFRGYRVVWVTPYRGSAVPTINDGERSWLWCPEQFGTKKSCLACGLCFRAGRRFALMAH